MTEQQAKDSVARIDGILKEVNTTRQSHLLLTQDIRNIQDRVKLSYEFEELLRSRGIDPFK